MIGGACEGRIRETDSLTERLPSQEALVTGVTLKVDRDCLPSNHEVLYNKILSLRDLVMRMRYALILVLMFTYSLGPAGWAQSQQAANETARKLVRKVEPRYPDVAKKMNLGGTVKLVAVVAADGKVTKVEPVGGSPILVEAAQSAITQWKFAPAGGESKETVELHFTP